MTTWTPKTRDAETWTAKAQNYGVRVFSPFVFSRFPVFDTGPSSGIWDPNTKQPEVWTRA